MNTQIFYIIIGISVVLLAICLYIIRNLLLKVEKYEQITLDQTTYLQSISDTIRDSRSYIQDLDANGHFQADDELGRFFDGMKNIQADLERYMLPENYGKEEKQ